MNAPNSESNTSNVVYMAEFLAHRRMKLKERRDHLTAVAEKISKSENAHNDAFAGPLLAKAAKFEEPIKDLERHIRFLLRGGNTMQIPARGYLLQHPNIPAPPSVNIQVTGLPQN